MTDRDHLAYEHNGEAIARERFYAIACDPRRSVVVEACAGAGKTWMLVSRMLRALLDGAQPHEILAITFTKKAAGEMRQRLHEWLAAFANASQAELDEALVQRGLAPQPQLREALQGLYRRLLATGRPVQVRTFHSWFAALLRNAPLSVLEALALPANYELLEDDKEAVALVWRRFYMSVVGEPQARADFEASVSQFGRFQTQRALHAALAKRVEFTLADLHGVVEASVKPFAEMFPRFGSLSEPEAALNGDVACRTWLARAGALGAQKNKTPQKAAQLIVDAFETDDLQERFSLLRKAFFVAGEDRLTAHLAKFEAAQEAEPELQALCAARAQHEAWLHHQRITRLARLLIAQFGALKRERGWIDMNDVERAALVMLSDPVLSGWVQEKLDARIRHLLIDEFQDTNPLQWQALNAWLSGYAGAGGARPSVFIVGDPKQSIYRFRRAEPAVFHAAKDFVTEALEGDLLSCDHTHRTAPALLDIVNDVMGQAQDEGRYTGFRPHTTQSKEAGQALRLPQIERAAKETRPAGDVDTLSWRDSLNEPRELPEEKLVTLECRQAAAWVAAQLAAGVAPGDVMVLARRRDRLGVMEDELRALHIPAQQPEKNELGEASEVQDIVALIDVLVSPTHDLSLARVLKSPLFDLSDEALVHLARSARQAALEGRPLPWFEIIQRQPLPDPFPAGLPEKLRRWKGLVDKLPPHDALEAIYQEGDVLARFGAAAPAPLREGMLANLRALLGAALQVDAARYATPYAFVRALKAGGVAAPAHAAPGAVRLLTVHGAKGLEAPVVLMLDTDGPPAKPESMGVIVEWPGEAPTPWRFAFLASETRPPACSSEALDVEFAARQREELNALYVAMTRARRQLVISSVQPHVAAEASWWRRLEPHCEAVAVPHAPEEATAAGAAASHFALPVAPGRQTPKPAVRPPAGVAATPDTRFGEAVHRLLEFHAPGASSWPPLQLQRVGREFGLDAGKLREAAAMASRIVAGEGAWAWDAGAVDWQGNEVELFHRGELLRLDRLVRRVAPGAAAEWWVLDFKSAWQPQRDPELVAKMQLYREAVATAYPGQPVKAAFLTGQGKLVKVA